MQLKLVFSNTVISIGYDSLKLELTIEFISGAVYTYLGVPEKTYQDILEAMSRNEHIYYYIKNFPYRPSE